MAKILVNQFIENDVFVLSFAVDKQSLSYDDKSRIGKYGEPVIQIGGTFLDGTPNEFTLPDKSVKFTSGFPFRQDFDSTTEPFDTNTTTKVLAYRDDILDRIDTAVEALRAQTDNFTGEYIHNI